MVATTANNIAARITFIPDADEPREKEPALVLFRPQQAGRRRYYIGLSAAWKFMNPDGYLTTTYAFKEAENIAEHLGLDKNSVFDRRQIYERLMTGIESLLSAPEWEMIRHDYEVRKARGEVLLKNHGELVGGEEIEDIFIRKGDLH